MAFGISEFGKPIGSAGTGTGETLTMPEQAPPCASGGVAKKGPDGKWQCPQTPGTNTLPGGQVAPETPQPVPPPTARPTFQNPSPTNFLTTTSGSQSEAPPTSQPRSSVWRPSTSQPTQGATTSVVPTDLGNTVAGTPGQGGYAPPPPSANPQYLNYYKQIVSALNQYGWPSDEDPNYWVQRTFEHGGDIDYFVSRIALGKGNQPGDGQPSIDGFLGGGTWTGPTGPTTPAPGAYKPGTAPTSNIPTYAPGTISQEKYAPSALQNPTQDLIQQLLTGTSLNPAVVAQMKEGQKSGILSMVEQLKQQAAQGAANRNVSGGGNLQAALRNLDLEGLGELSANYRNIDIQKAIQDQTDKLNAVGASQGFEQQLLNQFLGTGNLTLAQEQARNAEQQAGYQSQVDKETAQQKNYLDNETLQMQASAQAFQQWAAEQGLTLDWATAQNLAAQFAKSYGLNVAQFLSGGR